MLEKKVAIFIFSAFVLLGIFFFFIISFLFFSSSEFHKRNYYDKTVAGMELIKNSICQFELNTWKVPKDLNELKSTFPDLNENYSMDDWGRKILYEVDINQKLIILKSYGKDGSEGGINEDADIIGIFTIAKNTAELEKSLFNWVQKPEPRDKK